MRGSRQTLAGLLALAGLSVASVGNPVVVSPTGRTVSESPRLQNLPVSEAVRAVQNNAMRRRFEAVPQFKGPVRVRPRSTGSHKQNRRRALAGR